MLCDLNELSEIDADGMRYAVVGVTTSRAMSCSYVFGPATSGLLKYGIYAPNFVRTH